MTRRNKLRYKSQGNQFPSILLTGIITRRERDREEEDGEESEAGTALHAAAAPAPAPAKGDIQIFLSTDSNAHPSSIGDFYSIGLAGYLKANVWDGKGWKPLSLEEIFPDRLQYFGKRERPIDTFAVCLPALEQLQGVEIVRTYREHYRLKTPGDAGQ